jgi:hypothetical protein
LIIITRIQTHNLRLVLHREVRILNRRADLPPVSVVVDCFVAAKAGLLLPGVTRSHVLANPAHKPGITANRVPLAPSLLRVRALRRVLRASTPVRAGATLRLPLAASLLAVITSIAVLCGFAVVVTAASFWRPTTASLLGAAAVVDGRGLASMLPRAPVRVPRAARLLGVAALG